MLRIGLTGGIGSGKSTVADVFRALGAKVYVADMEARRLMNEDGELRLQLIKLLGKKVYNENGLDRQLVAQMIFQNSELLQKVNSLVHPVVQEDFDRWSSMFADENYVIEEAALLFESGAYKRMDYVVAVLADDECRIQRVVERDQSSRDAVIARIRQQLDQEEFRKRSDFTIINENDSMILPQIVALHNKFLKVY